MCRTLHDIDLPPYLGDYEFSVAPRSLFTPDGQLYKFTEKSVILNAGFGIWGERSHAHASVHAENLGDVQRKARLVWLRKFQGERQIARLKQQSSLSFNFCKTQRSYEKIMRIYLLFHWFSGENCIIRSSHRRCSI